MAVANDLTTDEEIDAAIEHARHLPDLPGAISGEYVAALDAIVIHLDGGRRLILPRKELQGLQNASEAQLGVIEVHGRSGIAWPLLDVDHYLPSLLIGQYGSRKWMRALDLKGMADTHENRISSVAKLRAFYCFEPLIAPIYYVQGKKLLRVEKIVEAGLWVGMNFAFNTNTLAVRSMPDDSIEVTLDYPAPVVEDAGREDPWKSYIGKPIRWLWLAMNQRGYVDCALLSFGSNTTPEISMTVAASGLEIACIHGNHS